MTPAPVPHDLTPDELAACDAMFDLLVAERDASAGSAPVAACASEEAVDADRLAVLLTA